jgi:hypothetical protein
MGSATRTREATVARKLVRTILAAGYQVSVHDGEEILLKRSTRFSDIVGVLGETDESVLTIRDANNERVGAIALIWGNDPSGEELIADYTNCDEIRRLIDGIN